MTPVVVKLGGSHADAPALRGAWLAALAAANGPVVLVPGGGPFADAVRARQAPLGYDDDTAHGMALLAMSQYGLVLAAAPGFAAAASLGRIGRVLSEGRVAVWLPHAMPARARGVVRGWATTSDSLALWLGARLGARAVLLVKRNSASPGLDTAFPAARARFAGEVRIAGQEHVVRRLDVAALPGVLLGGPAAHGRGGPATGGGGPGRGSGRPAPCPGTCAGTP